MTTYRPRFAQETANGLAYRIRPGLFLLFKFGGTVDLLWRGRAIPVAMPERFGGTLTARERLAYCRRFKDR